jgi:hypothetical protein
VLKINKVHFERVQREAIVVFENEMIKHCAEFSPRLSSVLRHDGLRTVIRAAMQRAAGYGFTFKGPVRLFIELSFLFGSAFDVDVQYAWARERLGEPNPHTQMQRAEALYLKSVEALERIHGPENSYTDAALHRLQFFASTGADLKTGKIQDIISAKMAHIHPQKYVYIGDPAMRALIVAAEAEAAQHGLSESHDVLLFVALMFSFGQGCTQDPLYPWIANTLRNERIRTPSARSNQLKRKSLTWLRHVLVNKKKEHE